MQSPLAIRAPGRPRCDATRGAVLRAAYELLGEGGIKRFTIDGVAARSGVARTTIYRWWPSKGALAIEGFLSAISAEINVEPTPSAIADMRKQLYLFARMVHGMAGQILRGIIAEGQSDGDTIKDFMTGFVAPRRAEARAIVERGIASGELRADLDVSMVLYSLFGPIYLRLILHEDLDEAFVDRLIDTVMGNYRALPA